MSRHGRKSTLDDGKRREILAILSVGCSQTVAARYVGCSPSTIRRAAERDAEFAAKLHRAQRNAEVSLVKNIRAAAKKEQYWRAAAWALERGFPEKYARRGPDVITAEQLAEILAQLAERIARHVPVAVYRKDIAKDVAAVARCFGRSIHLEAPVGETDDETEDDEGSLSGGANNPTATPTIEKPAGG